MPHSRPYMVVLQRHTQENVTVFCDGFLLNEVFVMTAAHCQAMLVCYIFIQLGILLIASPSLKITAHDFVTLIFQELHSLTGSPQFP